MINPITIVGAGVAALGVAFYQASSRTEGINEALISTGRNASFSAEEIKQLAASIDDVSGVTSGSAIDALSSLATTTNLSGDALKSAAAASAQWASVTGQSADTVVEKFRAISKDPVDALLKLNETERFLTQTQYDRVKALQDEGRFQEAATEAARIYADTVAGRATEIEANLGLISTAWKNIKTGAREAWDEIVSGIDRVQGPLQTLADRIAGLGGAQRTLVRNALNALNPIAGGLVGFGGDAFRGVSSSVDSTARAGSGAAILDSAEVKRAQQYSQEWMSIVASTDKTVRNNREIARIREAGRLAGKSEAEINAQVEAYNRSIADTTSRSATSVRQRKDAITEEERAAKSLAASYASITAQLERQIALGGNNSNLARVNYDISNGNLRGLGASEQANARELAGIADIEDDFNAIYGGYDRITYKAEESAEKMSQFGIQAARNIQTAFADFLFDPFEDGLDGMLDSFAKTLQRMAANAAASKVFEAIGAAASSYTGKGAAGINAIGALFSKGHSEGGYTGDGGKYQPKGIVHAGEVVWSQKDVAAVGGPKRANAMRPTAGYANGGIVGSSSSVRSSAPEVSVVINNQGGALDVQSQSTRQMPNGKVLVELVTSTVKSGFNSGMFDSDMGANFGVRRVGRA